MKKPVNSQRKSPRQSRSRAIVDAIFEATIRILPKIGSDNVTTKKIADLAGISIGSLYQYFPNKESVLAGLIDAGVSASIKDFEKKLSEIDGRTMPESTDMIIDFALDLFLKEKDKMREIYKKASELGRVRSLLEARQMAVHRLALEMQKHHPGKPENEYVRVSFVAVNSVMGVIQIMLMDEQQSYSKDELSFELKVMLNAFFIERSKPK